MWKYFKLSELTHTNTGLLNVPNKEQIDNLTELVENILDPLRGMLNEPIKVNSGFRSVLVNQYIKGAKTSQHMKGEAADLDFHDNKLLFDTIRKNFDFDQLIWEAGDDKKPAWVHVSYKKNGQNRKEVLRMKNGKYTKM